MIFHSFFHFICEFELQVTIFLLITSLNMLNKKYDNFTKNCIES